MDDQPDDAAVTGDIDFRPGPDAPEFSDETLRAGVIAHAIKLGKCPPAGVTIGFNVQMRRADASVLQTGDLSSAENITGKIPFSFTVTAKDIENGQRLIEAEKITHREPKMSILPLKQS